MQSSNGSTIAQRVAARIADSRSLERVRHGLDEIMRTRIRGVPYGTSCLKSLPWLAALWVTGRRDVRTSLLLRAEWIETRRSLGRHIAYLEAGNKIHPLDQDPHKATAEFLERLKQYRLEVETWLRDLPSE